MGFDWSGLIDTGLSTVSSIWGNNNVNPSAYPAGYPSTYQAQDSAFDWESLVSMGALLVGGYFLLKTVTKRR